MQKELFYNLSILICAAVLLLSMIIFPPFWGLMDDAMLIYSLIPSMDEAGIFPQAWKFALDDIGWGMFRPLYPIMAYLLYKPGILISPWVTFAINSLFSVMLIAGFASVWAKILNLNWKEILLLNIAFLYQFDLLQHPSLQEKIVLFFGLLLVGTIWWAPRRLLVPLCLALLLLGFSAKASFIIYFGVGIALVCGRYRHELELRKLSAVFPVLIFILVGGAAVGVLGKIASQGIYTASSRFSISNVFPNLLSIHGAFYSAVLLAALVMHIRCWRLRRVHPEALAPLFGIILFLMVFLPWNIRGYIQTIVGPLLAVIVCQLSSFYLPNKLRPIFWSLVCSAAVAATAYRAPTMFLRLHDLGRIVKGWEGIVPERKVLNMPCIEGSSAMQAFLRNAGHTVTVNLSADPHTIGKGIWLYDGSMCALPGGMNPLGCKQTTYYSSLWSKSYRVVYLECGNEEG